MAGGSGSRFWPHSRKKRSKQFLSLVGKQTLIESTVRRFLPLTSPDHLFVVSNIGQKCEMEKQHLPVPSQNIIYEPIGKNTAPCIGLAALFVEARDPEAIMVVSPADHLIRQEDRFRKTVMAAVSLAGQKDALVTIGIQPDRPATGYGYIQIKENLGKLNGISSFSVRTFAEKPNLATAERFLKSGDFYWNSGIFIFKISVLLKAFEKYAPDLYEALLTLKKVIGNNNYEETLEKVYRQIRGISIDYAIMEKADNVFLVKGEFEWNDLGSWEQTYKLSKKDSDGNAIQGDVVTMDSRNCYISTSSGVIAVIGMEDIIIVQEKDATLICRRDRVEDVKKIVERFKRKNLQKYL